MCSGPTAEVIQLFGSSGTPVQLEGGQGKTWRIENVVFKRVEPTNARFEALLARSLPQVGYRLATPIESSTESWTVDGWAAYSFVTGHYSLGQNVEERFESSRRFHHDLRSFAYPSHFDEQMDPWSIAQRIAFGTQLWDPSAPLASLLKRMRSIDRASRDSWQIIHADIAGNFLFDPMCDPAIIDLTLAWSPKGFAEAVMALDIVLWEGVRLEDVLSLLEPDESELIPLATIRRLLEMDTLHRLGGFPKTIYDQVEQYEDFVELLCGL